VFIWQFASLMYSSALVVYLLKTVGVSYLFYNFIIAVYSLFFIFFSAYWQRLIARRSWLLTYAVTLLIRIPAQAAFAFVSPLNYIWLMLAVRFPQHFVGVGQNVCYANMQYLNMPKEHRTCFTAFYQLVSNTGSLLGLMTGTAFVAATADVSFNILGITISNVPMLILFDSALELVIAVYVLIFRKKLTPPTAENI
jgi:hypothetical protein